MEGDHNKPTDVTRKSQINELRLILYVTIIESSSAIQGLILGQNKAAKPVRSKFYKTHSSGKLSMTPIFAALFSCFVSPRLSALSFRGCDRINFKNKC